jgi:hypothetical protein
MIDYVLCVSFNHRPSLINARGERKYFPPPQTFNTYAKSNRRVRTIHHATQKGDMPDSNGADDDSSGDSSEHNEDETEPLLERL